MPHVFARMTGVGIDPVRAQLEADAAKHREQGMVLEHLWSELTEPFGQAAPSYTIFQSLPSSFQYWRFFIRFDRLLLL